MFRGLGTGTAWAFVCGRQFWSGEVGEKSTVSTSKPDDDLLSTSEKSSGILLNN